MHHNILRALRYQRTKLATLASHLGGLETTPLSNRF